MLYKEASGGVGEVGVELRYFGLTPLRSSCIRGGERQGGCGEGRQKEEAYR